MTHFTYVMHMGHRLQREGKYTGVLANRFINKCKSIEIQERLHYLSCQVQIHFPQPSCGLFKFDWPYYYTVSFSLILNKNLLL